MIRMFLRRFFSLPLLIGGLFGVVGGIFALVGLGVASENRSWAPWIFVAAGSLVALGGLGGIGYAGWKAWQAAWLVGYGRVAEAVVVAISSDQSMTINDRHPKFLRYQFVLPASGEKVKASGPHLGLAEESRWKVGDKLRIAYHPNDPQVSTPLPDTR
jgi:hypothetical protein